MSKQKYGSYVWFLSGLFLLAYAGLGLTGAQVPGVEELINFMENARGPYLYLAAFISILIEGLYGIGSFFPGATLVLIVAVVSGLNSFTFFASTILTIFLGWVLAGAINIWMATHYRRRLISHEAAQDFIVHDRVWTTWFPSFRANYEVAQVTEGGDPKVVFFSSLRVRFWACLAAACCAYALPYLIDINEIGNEEGFWSVIAVAVISIAVGVYKLKTAYDLPTTDSLSRQTTSDPNQSRQ